MIEKNTPPKKHNPKSYNYAVYIPCWLSQVTHNHLSFGAKLLYGRLAQWCSTKGDAYRSAPQLSLELGMAVRTVKKFIKELKDCKLIDTYQPQAGGSNHFIFYDHEWMHLPLVDELSYTPNPVHNNAPTQCTTVHGGGAQPCTGVVHNRAPINIKKIKENKKDNKALSKNDENLKNSQSVLKQPNAELSIEAQTDSSCLEPRDIGLTNLALAPQAPRSPHAPLDSNSKNKPPKTQLPKGVAINCKPSAAIKKIKEIENKIEIPDEIIFFSKWAKANDVPQLTKVTKKIIDILDKAKLILKAHDLLFFDYLMFLEDECSWFLDPYVKNNTERRNNFQTLMRPSNIKKVIAGKFTERN